MLTPPQKILTGVIALLFVIVFAVCMSPYGLLRLLGEPESSAVRELFWNYRFQSMCLFLGLMLAFGGVRTMITKQFSTNRNGDPGKQGSSQGILMRRHIPLSFDLSGREAIRYGWVMLVIAAVLLLIGIHFWLFVFLPEILKQT